MKRKQKNDGLFKRYWTDKATGKRTESRYWYFRYRDHRGIVRTVKGCRDKSATEYQKAQLVSQAEKIDRGLISAEVLEVNRPLSEHLADWQQNMIAAGSKPATASLAHERAARVFAKCGATHYCDISASKVQLVLSRLQREVLKRNGDKVEPVEIGPVSDQTRKYYMQAVRQFCKWMVEDGRAVENPLVTVRVRGGSSKERAALEPVELAKLIQWTRTGATWRGITGEQRATVYQFAAGTGLRSNEIRSLRVRDFDLTANTVTLAGECTKNGKDAVLPLTMPGLVDALKEQLAGKHPAAEALTLPSRYDMADMLRQDMTKAGILEQVQERGLVDFHSLRHSFASMLAASGIHPKTAQELLRHSTVTLTLDRYSHTLRGALAEAVAALPDVNRVAAAATGTDAGEILLIQKPLQTSAQKGRKVSASVPSLPKTQKAVGCHTTSQNGDSTQSEAMRVLGLEPRTYELKVRCSTY